MTHRYKNSEAMLARAEAVIPLGSQTFSKSRTQYPYGVSPYFIEKGKGAIVTDVDGNEYLDAINALAAITLGHCDEDVSKAVKAQVDEGVIFSLSHRLETEVAERIVAMVPSAEKVRFGKNGSDATSGAIRVARAFTGRDRIAMCGYHGWQDWSIGTTTRNKGIPKAVCELTHLFPYNNIEALDTLLAAHKDEFAAIILEPMNVEYPKKDYFLELKECAHKHGALLIFDETITGFRFANGGAQEFFNVSPDISTFGKGIANGYPLSAVVGRADVMKFMEEVFFSFTMGGETMSLAAARATLDKLRNEPVTQTIAKHGKRALEETEKLIRKYNLQDVLQTTGHPSWGFVLFKDAHSYSSFEIKTLFLQEVFARGLLTLGTHNFSYAWGEAEVNKLLSIYDEVFAVLADAVFNRAMAQFLKCQPLVPLFKVR